MVNRSLQKILQQFYLEAAPAKHAQQPLRRSPDASNSGFTLLEVIVVVLIIAILSAIMAPSWLAFLNRQRVSKVNDAVLGALQEAQREAKRTKLSYSASFKTDTDKSLKVAVYPAKDASGNVVNISASGFNGWKSLADTQDIKPGVVGLCSNITQNQPNNKDNSPSCDLTTPRTITFDYQGALANKADDSSPVPGLAITVVGPNGNPKRCVIVKTLLGTMITGQDAYDATNNPNGCPSS